MNRTVRKIFEEIRSGKSEWNADQIVDHLSKADPKPTASDLWEICSQLREKQAVKPTKKPTEPSGSHQNRSAEGLPGDLWNLAPRVLQQELPSIVRDFAADYLTALQPKRLLNPWADEPVGVCALLNAIPSLREALSLIHI